MLRTFNAFYSSKLECFLNSNVLLIMFYFAKRLTSKMFSSVESCVGGCSNKIDHVTKELIISEIISEIDAS